MTVLLCRVTRTESVFSRPYIAVVGGWLAGAALVALLSGCAAPPPTGPDGRAGHVYLIRGWFDIFSAGMGTLNARLLEQKVDAQDVSNLGSGAVLDSILKHRAAGDDEPIILGGHSAGANNAVNVAWELARRDIPVELLVLIDDTLPPPTPRNVKKVLIISGRGSLARTAEPHGRWQTPPEEEVFPVALVPVPGVSHALGQLQHFWLEKEPRVHDKIVAEVLKICPPRSEWTAAKARRLREGGSAAAVRAASKDSPTPTHHPITGMSPASKSSSSVAAPPAVVPPAVMPPTTPRPPMTVPEPKPPTAAPASRVPGTLEAVPAIP